MLTSRLEPWNASDKETETIASTLCPCTGRGVAAAGTAVCGARSAAGRAAGGAPFCPQMFPAELLLDAHPQPVEPLTWQQLPPATAEPHCLPEQDEEQWPRLPSGHVNMAQPLVDPATLQLEA